MTNLSQVTDTLLSVTCFFMEKRLRNTVVLFLASITLMGGLYFHREMSIPKNGFLRRFIQTPLTVRANIQHSGLHYIAGVTRSGVFLGSPGRADVVAIDLTGRKKGLRSIKFNTQNFSTPKIVLDSPHYFIQQLGGNRIAHGFLGKDSVITLLNTTTLLIDVIPISSHSLILKTLSEDGNSFVLAKKYDSTLIKRPDLLEHQIDGKFCTDGVFQFNATRDTLVYAYYYRNQFLCLDSSLNLLFKANTIDTNRYAKISVSHIDSKKFTSLSSPARIVNQQIRIGDHRILIQSNLVADNENKQDFNTHTVIDVYSLSQGTYLYSFYIPKNGRKRLLDFRLHENQLFVLYPETLEVYAFNSTELDSE